VKKFCSYLIVLLTVSSCSVSSKSREPEKTDEASTQKVSSAEVHVQEFRDSINLLARVTSPADSRIRDEKGIEESSNGLALVADDVTPVKKKFSNTFSLSAELFSDIGFGRLEANSTDNKFSVSFESLKAKQLSYDQVKVYLSYNGQAADDSTSIDSEDIFVKLVIDGKTKSYKVYSREASDSDSSTSATISFDELNKFFQDFSKYTDIEQAFGVSGYITVTKDNEFLALEGSHIGWFSESYSIVAYDLSAQQTVKTQTLQSLLIDGQAYNGDGSDIGSLKLKFSNLSKDNQSIEVYFGDSYVGAEIQQ